MDGIRELLETLRDRGLPAGHLRGLMHVAIGRKITKTDGTVVSAGLTWRELSAQLKAARFDKELVREFVADPDALSPRDRERFWYAAISAAGVDTAEAFAQADKVIALLKPLGYLVGKAPSAAPPPVAPAPPPATAEEKPKKPGKRRK